MFGAAAAYRDKHRLQPCEPKPRHAEARKTRPADFGTRIFLVPLLKPRTGCGSRNTANYKTAEQENRRKKTPDKTNNLLTLLRHYAASGLLNLQTTLMRTMIRTTPGVKLLSHEDRASRSQKQMNFAFSRPIEVC